MCKRYKTSDSSHLQKALPTFSTLIFKFSTAIMVLSWCCGRVQSPNDAIQKKSNTKKNNTMIITTQQHKIEQTMVSSTPRNIPGKTENILLTGVGRGPVRERSYQQSSNSREQVKGLISNYYYLLELFSLKNETFSFFFF